MRTPTSPKGLRERPSIRVRARGLQSLMGTGCEERSRRQEVLNRLNQLRWEKERLRQERRNWEQKLKVIDKRLAEIADAEAGLEREFLSESARTPCESRRAGQDAVGDLVFRY